MAIEGLMGAPLGSTSGKRLDELVAQVEAWERQRYQLEESGASKRKGRV